MAPIAMSVPLVNNIVQVQSQYSKIAHLRRLENDVTKCEFLFRLEIPEHIVGVAIEEDIRACWRTAASVRSFLEHMDRKVFKLIQIKRGGEEILTDKFKDLNISKTNVFEPNCLKQNKTLDELISSEQDVFFEICDIRYLVKINDPTVICIELPEVIYAESLVQPIKIETMHCKLDLSHFKWYKSKDKIKWSQVSDKLEYFVTEHDVDHYLKFVVIPRNKRIDDIRIGFHAEEISKDKVESFNLAPVYPFERRHEYTREALSENEFRVVSYNTLSSRYCEVSSFQLKSFPYCPPRFLSMDYRKHVIVKEILGYRADIVCLQEVDEKHYHSFFKEQYENNGYSSEYHKKGNRISEGLVCIYNDNRFDLIKSTQIVLREVIQQLDMFKNLWYILKSNEDVRRCFMDQATSLQITVLKLRVSNALIIVGNTHLIYRPELTHIRLLIVHMITQYLHYLRNEELKSNNKVSVILCGDFNSRATSPVVRYLIDGKVDPNHTQCLRVAHEGLELYHELSLESACGFPKYTNYTKTFKDCLDYIFIDKSSLSVAQSIPMPSEEELAEYEGLPNDVYPSDHLALVADITLI